MNTKKYTAIDISIQIALIAILAIWCFQIARPFISPIAWAGIIAIGTYPIFVWVKKKTGLAAGWSATIVSLALIFTLIIPTILISGALIDNTHSLSNNLGGKELIIPAPPESVAQWPLIGKSLSSIWMQASQDPKAVMGKYTSEIKSFIKWLVKTAASASLNILVFVFSIVIAGVFMVSGRAIKENFIAIFDRVAGGRGCELTELSLKTVNSVVTGILGIALIQSLLAGLGFIAMGIPAAGVLAFICLILAIVQIDILLILIPLSIWTFSSPETSTGAAIAFLVWNIGVGLMNNVLKPILLSKGVDAPMSVIFVGAIGGMMLSGIIGLFVGAVIMVVGFTLFMAWLNPEILDKEIKDA